jgi:hypothetical protein
MISIIMNVFYKYLIIYVDESFYFCFFLYNNNYIYNIIIYARF